MWLTYVALVLVVIAVIVGIVGGGVFTIILVPLAVIAVFAAVVAAGAARAASRAAGGEDPVSSGPEAGRLPRHRRRPAGRTATTPDALVDARQEQQ